jgi:hypothetical protein
MWNSLMRPPRIDADFAWVTLEYDEGATGTPGTGHSHCSIERILIQA